MRILWLEDDEGLRAHLPEQIVALGHAVTMVADVVTLHVALAAYSWDALVLDVGALGYPLDVLHSIRRGYGGPIVLASGEDPRKLRALAGGYGCAVAEKPYRVEDVLRECGGEVVR